ncbi:MAG: DUF2089 family protein [Bacteroidota bacterium]
MAKSLPITCPSCNTGLKVKSLQCDKCGTSVEGLFDLPPIASIPADDQLFVLHFIKCSGSLKDMAKHLNLSYPTVRNMLDEIIGRITKIEKTISK